MDRFLNQKLSTMAKKIIIPPKKSIKTKIKDIVSQGPKPKASTIAAQRPNKSHVAQVQQSRLPNPAANQRGRIKSKDEKDLTR